MSYNLVVWDGERPADDEAALATFLELMDALEAGYDAPPLPTVAAYVGALLDRWPDLGTPGADTYGSPWADGPLLQDAVGPVVYFGVVADRAEEAAGFVAETASLHGLVCFDPQLARLR